MTKMINVKINGKWNILLPKHRADRPEWHTNEGWERKRLDHMSQHIGAGDVVYYVGAEEGDMCALCVKWGADIVLFEPNDKVSPNIKAIWKANKLKEPLAYFEGFAANTTDFKDSNPLTVNGFPESADGKVIGDHGFKELAYEYDVVPQIRIDDMVQKTGHIPTVLNMDVEGSEFEVLKGAARTLIDHKPLIYLSLHPEFLFRMFDVYSMDVRKWIIGFGYKEELIDYQHEVHLFYEPL